MGLEVLGPSASWERQSQQAKLSVAVLVLSVVLGAAINLGFAMLLIVAGHILCDVRAMKLGFERIWENEKQSGEETVLENEDL